MGTRAQFFIGNPEDLERREYLGTTGWDGYPDGWIEPLKDAKTEAEFRALVAELAGTRDDFADPKIRSFPFPWKNDLFLTDCTYAWFPKTTDAADDSEPGVEGKVMFTYYHRGWIEMRLYLEDEAAREAYRAGVEALPNNVPAPVSDKPKGPDSIMVVSW
jgi:hypothetical protein